MRQVIPLIQEILCPGSVALVSIYGSNENRYAGFTRICYADTDLYATIEHEKLETDILVGLGGAAATERKFGTFDLGAKGDIGEVFRIIHSLNEDSCFNGFNLYDYNSDRSDILVHSHEIVAATEANRYFRKVKQIIAENMDKLEILD